MLAVEMRRDARWRDRNKALVSLGELLIGISSFRRRCTCYARLL